MNEHATQLVEPTGAISGRYEVREERTDGSLVIAPDTSIDAIRARHGSRAATREEIDDLFGELPTDGEG